MNTFSPIGTPLQGSANATPLNGIPVAQQRIDTYSGDQSKALDHMTHHLTNPEHPPHVGSIAANDANAAENDDEGAVSLAGLDFQQRTRAQSMAAMRKLVGQRLVEARETAGLSQSELARLLGHKNSTQPNLWEQGKRLPPTNELVAVVQVLGISLDYMYGLSDEPERDVQIARRTALTSRLQLMLSGTADALADAVLAGDSDLEGQIRACGLVSKVSALAQAVERFALANEAVFDDLRGGALLLRTAVEAGDAAGLIDRALSTIAERQERAIRRARLVASRP
jgi:DNA-binding transcriptional regulator YiaG